jgi:hypothetical protein
MIEQLNKYADLRVVAVTSPAVGDGKTITAINLAGTLAQAPQVRVLLVEDALSIVYQTKIIGLIFNSDETLALEPYHAYTQCAEEGKQRRWRR